MSFCRKNEKKYTGLFLIIYLYFSVVGVSADCRES